MQCNVTEDGGARRTTLNVSGGQPADGKLSAPPSNLEIAVCLVRRSVASTPPLSEVTVFADGTLSAPPNRSSDTVTVMSRAGVTAAPSNRSSDERGGARVALSSPSLGPPEWGECGGGGATERVVVSPSSASAL